MEYCGSLHNHTHFSNLRLRDCIIKEKDLLEEATKLGHSVVAFTDHETISSWVKVENLMKNYPNLKILRGNEIYLVRNGLTNENFNSEFDKFYHFVLIAKDLVGAKQIMEISTRAWNRSYMRRGMRRVPTYYQDLFDVVKANPGHVIGSTACLGGALPTQILRAQSNPMLWAKIEVWIKQMDDIFGHGNFYFELQPSKNREQIIVNKKLIEFSEKFGIKYIITTDSHYLEKEDRVVHKAYLNAQNGDREVDDFYASTYMMNTKELESYFKYLRKEQLDEAYAAIQEIADKCEDFSIKKPLRIPNLDWLEPHPKAAPHDYFEKIPYMKTFMGSDFVGDHILCDAIVASIEAHEDLQNQDAYDEINSNLEATWKSSIANNTHWSAYFLNLQKIIAECWNAGTLVGPSRGSGGGFLLLYVLGITQINPLREKTKLFAWRFLNPDRVSVLDIDCDIEGGRRQQVLSHLKSVYGQDRVANVATFGTEKSKSAILTAARGLGIDVDIASYLSSLIVADRGQLRSLSETFYGDEEKGFHPNKQFVKEMTDNYPELWKVAQKIEGLICRQGVHAGGVVFVDEPFTESTALLRAPDGTICTQFELHDLEECSLIKMDLLSVEALDKIHNCLDLLCDYGYIERKDSLKETYEDTIGIYKLERDDPKMWEMIWNHEIESLFQMEKQSGIQGIAIAKPKSVDELAVLNSVIRLMAADSRSEIPLNMWGRYREDISQWIYQMEKYGLSDEEIDWLSHHSAITDGICESQEGLMSLIQEEKLGGNSLSFADSCRKALAKKIGPLFVKCEEEFYQNAEDKGCDMRLAHYVWDVLLRVQRGYSFCRAHTLAYSFLALQEMNLAYKYPIIFWNCACLISDSGGGEIEEDEDVYADGGDTTIYYNEMEEFNEDEDKEISSYEEEDCDGYPADVVVTETGKKKKKLKVTNYGKIATAIGKMKSHGITIAPPHINESTYTFTPNVERNEILHGMSGITRISQDLIQMIMNNRPYESVEDFLKKVKVNKTQMINLIKSGAFDCFGDRIEIMKDYLLSVSDQKKRVTLQNLKMLFDFGLIPDDYEMQKKIFFFSKYLKKNKIGTEFFGLDNIAFKFYEENCDMDKLVPGETESGFMISKDNWDVQYQHHMNIIRPYVKSHSGDLLKLMNARLFNDVWEKYATGSLSKWEMDSVSYYSHEHELAAINEYDYGFVDFFELSENPEIDRVIMIKGKQVPLFKIHRIMGTVLDRDKAKKTVTLLTKRGVVTVKIFGDVFTHYDRQLSEKGADGKKHVTDKSWLSRGTKIVVTGIRREDSFIAKKYSRTPFHLVEKIVSIDGDEITLSGERKTE